MHWPGIEPGPPAWQASILPLNHQCLKFNCLNWRTKRKFIQNVFKRKLNLIQVSESEELSLEEVFELSLENFNGGVILFFGDEGFANSFPSSGIAFCSTLNHKC